MPAPIVLVANRGEIALRVFGTARRLGFGCVAVYSDADALAPYVAAADSAVPLGPAPASESYLRVDRVIGAALDSGATLVHPGYGFLAEDPRLAEACAAAGLTFVGPPADVLRVMGDKAAAKGAAVDAGLPVLSAGSDDGDVERAATALEYPVLLKPAAGGGGKGMVVVREAPELADAIASAKRIARSSFGDERLLVERYLPAARHVEVQVIADVHGNAVHLGERDCSVQRRHQKVVEESPSPGIDGATRAALCEAAVRLVRHTGYVNAGTCEFLVGPDGGFGFIEMNARLQVEHAVSEAVTGIDLVEAQLRVALGEPLAFTQDDVRQKGHAIEARVYAESPSDGFLPRTGRVAHVRWSPRVRVDAGVEEGSEVTAHYDPMLAKVIAHADDRASAVSILRDALVSCEVLGVETNLGFLARLVDSDEVRSGAVTTAWLDGAAPGIVTVSEGCPPEAIAVAAAAEVARRADPRATDPWARLGPWRIGGGGASKVVVHHDGGEAVVDVRGPDVSGKQVARAAGCHAWTVDGVRAAAAESEDGWFVWWDGAQHEVHVGPAPRSVEASGTAQLGAPMPGTVIAVRVEAGDRVSRGQELVVVEAMKMEHPVRSPADGVVRGVLCAEGQQVERGQPLVHVDADN